MFRLSFLLFSMSLLSACATGSGTVSEGRTYPGPPGKSYDNVAARDVVEKATKPSKNTLSEKERMSMVNEVYKNITESQSGRAVCSEVNTVHVGCKWFNFALNETKTLNAYPWGESGVSVNKAILAYTENDHEIAYMLAHQMGHVLARHVSENIEYSVANKQGGMGVLAYLICGVGCVQNIPAYGAQKRAEALQEEWETSFDHTQEREADYIAVYLMESAGYDISIGRNFLLKMAALNPENGTEAKGKAGYFDLHAFNPAQYARVLAAKQEFLAKKRTGKDILPTAKKPEVKEYY